MEETVELPQLHLLCNSLRVAHRHGDELMWGFFRALYTGTGQGAGTWLP